MYHEANLQYAKMELGMKALKEALKSKKSEDLQRAVELTDLTWTEAKPALVRAVDNTQQDEQFALLDGVLLKDMDYVNLPKGDRQDCYTALRELIQQNSITQENVSAALDLIPNRSMTTRTRQELGTDIMYRFTPFPDDDGGDLDDEFSANGNGIHGANNGAQAAVAKFDYQSDPEDEMSFDSGDVKASDDMIEDGVRSNGR